MPTIINYKLMQDYALGAIDNYLRKKREENDQNSLGFRRAVKMQAYLEYNENVEPEAIRNANIVAILFALFGKRNAGFMGKKFGRSSVLAEKIATPLFTGGYSFGTGSKDPETLGSTVFSEEAVQMAQSDHDNLWINVEAACGHFERVYGVRHLLEYAFLNDLQANYLPAFQAMVRNIKRDFEKKEPVNFENLLTLDSNLSELPSLVSESSVAGDSEEDDSDTASTISDTGSVRRM